MQLSHCRSNLRGVLTWASLSQITEKVFPDMCWCPGLYPCPALYVCACGTEQNRGKWKSSYAGASHRCPAPSPIHITACSVCIPLWHCSKGALDRPAGGPISKKSMSVELPRECKRPGCSWILALLELNKGYAVNYEKKKYQLLQFLNCVNKLYFKNIFRHGKRNNTLVEE